MFEIWGVKTIALFDSWSIEHFFSGVAIGYVIMKRNDSIFAKIFGRKNHGVRSFHFDIIGVLFLAYLWESIEHYLEIGLLGNAVAYWFQGVEFWANRLITDPLLVVLGFLWARHHGWAIWPARIFTFLWLFFHIFVFPHSMYLHEIL